MINNPNTIFAQCAKVYDISNNNVNSAILQCISDRVTTLELQQQHNTIDTMNWILFFCSGLIFIMQCGFAMICAGFVRKKNLINTMLKNLLDVSSTAIAFYSFGYAFAFGSETITTDTTFIGTTGFFGTYDSTITNNNNNNFNYSLWFFHFVMASSVVSIISGTLAERCKVLSFICYSFYISSFVYPFLIHTIWSTNGIFSTSNVSNLYRGIGIVDFSGAGIIHITGGGIALIASTILGPRYGRFYDELGNVLDKPNTFQGSSTVLQTLGALVLWFGWFGFNAGSALTVTTNTIPLSHLAANCVVNTVLSGSAGALSALLYNMNQCYRIERRRRIKSTEHAATITQGPIQIIYSLQMVVNGALSGLVAITSACGTVSLWGSIIIGTIAGIIYYYGEKLLYKYKIDDVVLGIPIHLLNGIWSMIATGLFSTQRGMNNVYGTDKYIGLLYEFGRAIGSSGSEKINGILFTNQLIGVCFIIGWISITTTPLFLYINYKGWFRTDTSTEILGLDHSFHGGIHGTNNNNSNTNKVETYGDCVDLYTSLTGKGSLGKQLLDSDHSKKGTTVDDDIDNDDDDKMNQVIDIKNNNATR